MFTEKEQFVVDAIKGTIEHPNYAFNDVERCYISMQWALKFAGQAPEERYGAGQPQFKATVANLLEQGLIGQVKRSKKTFYTMA
jgi:hypothetical protein